jgi:hypothetical protein
MTGEARLIPPKDATGPVPQKSLLVNRMVGYQDKRRLLEALKAALDDHAA